MFAGVTSQLHKMLLTVIPEPGQIKLQSPERVSATTRQLRCNGPSVGLSSKVAAADMSL